MVHNVFICITTLVVYGLVVTPIAIGQAFLAPNYAYCTDTVQ